MTIARLTGLLILMLAAEAAANDVLVSGVARLSSGAPAAGYTVELCVEVSGGRLSDDTTSQHGVFHFYKPNVLGDVDRLYLIHATDSTIAAPQRISLDHRAPRAGKSGDFIIRRHDEVATIDDAARMIAAHSDTHAIRVATGSIPPEEAMTRTSAAVAELLLRATGGRIPTEQEIRLLGDGVLQHIRLPGSERLFNPEEALTIVNDPVRRRAIAEHSTIGDVGRFNMTFDALQTAEGLRAFRALKRPEEIGLNPVMDPAVIAAVRARLRELDERGVVTVLELKREIDGVDVSDTITINELRTEEQVRQWIQRSPLAREFALQTALNAEGALRMLANAPHIPDSLDRVRVQVLQPK